MIDYFALALTHGLMALATWRMLLRGDLDSDPPPAPPASSPEPETLADRLKAKGQRTGA